MKSIVSLVLVCLLTPGFAAAQALRADLNSDGKSDLLWRNAATGALRVWGMDGVRPFSGVDLPPVTDLAWQVAATGDLTGDRKADIVWRHAVNGQVLVWEMDGTRFVRGHSLPTVSDLGWLIGGAADFTGDGLTDILWRHGGNGTVHVWEMNGVRPVRGIDLPRVADLGWQLAGAGDLTGDGRPDILWRHFNDGRVHAWEMNGMAVVRGLDLPPVTDLGWRIGSVADYTGDGRADLVWQHRGDGRLVGWQMDGVRASGFFALPTVTDTAWRLGGVTEHRLNRDLVAHYRLDGDTYDISGQGNHLVLNGARFAPDQRGRDNAALATTTQTGAVSARNIGISGRGARTVSVWTRLNRTPVWNDGTILQWGTGMRGYFGLQYHAATDPGAYFRGSNLVWDAGFAGAAVRTGPADLVSRWHHLVLVYDGTDARFYLDGRLQSANTTNRDLAAIATADSPLRVGNNGNRGVSAAMDNIRVYRRALSEAEVAELFALENGGRGAAFTAGLYAGRFSGPGDEGEFYAFVGSDGSAVAVGYNFAGSEGVATSVTIPPSGVFEGVTQEGATYRGRWTHSKAEGEYTGTDGDRGVFSLVRLPDAGDFWASAGVYRGNYDIPGDVSGTLTIIVAVDGSFWFHAADARGTGGGYGMAGPGNTFSGSVLPASLGLSISGTFDPVAGRLTGRITGSASGSLSAMRTKGPDWPLAKNDAAGPDFTGDGRADIVWRHAVNGAVHVWEMEGTRLVRGHDLPRVGDLGWQIGGTGDFTGDGKVDVLWRHAVNGAVHVWEMDGVRAVRGHDLPRVGDLGWQVGGVGDLSGDGRPDIVWRHSVNGRVYVWRMDGLVPVQGVDLPGVGDQGWQIAAVGDWSGDGWADVLWRHAVDGRVVLWQTARMQLGQAAGLPTVSDLGWRIGGKGDFNGDGWLDVLWRNTANGAVHVWQMEGTTSKAGLNLPPVTDVNWLIFNR